MDYVAATRNGAPLGSAGAGDDIASLRLELDQAMHADLDPI
jgi:hypothetical protein